MPQLKRRRKLKEEKLPKKKKRFEDLGPKIHLTTPMKVRMFLSRATNQCHRGLIDDKTLRACAYACQVLMSVFKFNREGEIEDRIEKLEELIREQAIENRKPVETSQIRKIFKIQKQHNSRKVSNDVAQDAVQCSDVSNQTESSQAKEIKAEETTQESATPRLRRTANGNVIKIARR